MGGRLDSTNVVRPVSRSSPASPSTTPGNWATPWRRSPARRPESSSGRGPRSAACATPRPARRSTASRPSDAARCASWAATFDFETLPPRPPLRAPDPRRGHVANLADRLGPLELPLLGPHQAHNAAVALAGLDVLAELEPALAVDREAVVEGFSSLRWPARVEVLGESPWLVIDGAHNVASAEALAETLRTCFPASPRTLVFGTTRDKDLHGQLRALLPLFDTVIATRYVENPRSVPPKTSPRRYRHRRPNRADRPRPGGGPRSGPPPDGPLALICVTGSLFLAAESRAILLGQESVRPVTGVVI